MEVKVNCYNLLIECKINKQKYYILGDGEVLILTKKENCVPMGKATYSLIYPQEKTFEIMSVIDFNMLAIDKMNVTISRGDKNV